MFWGVQEADAMGLVLEERLREILDKRLVDTGYKILQCPYPAPINAAVDNADTFPHLKGRKPRKM